MATDELPPDNEEPKAPSRAEIYERLDRSTIVIRREERERLRAILECDRHDLWTGNGARSHAEFLAARCNISQFKARRWIAAAYALEYLPHVSHALESGVLSLDTVVELSRFATAKTEAKLVKWARKVTPSAVRRRADEESRISHEKIAGAETDRSLDWMPSLDGTAIRAEAQLPAAEGEIFTAAIDALARELPATPLPDGSLPESSIDLAQRRADALLLMASAVLADDQTSARPKLVIHAPIEVLTGETTEKNAAFANGPVTSPTVLRRLACDADLDLQFYGDEGTVGLAKPTKYIPPWLRRAVLWRDSFTCTFPGCEMKRFLVPHHIEWRCVTGPTQLDNLVTVCSTHHKLVHEHGWGVKLEGDVAVWFRPGGRRHEPGPAPPYTPSPPQQETDAPWPALFHMLQGDNHAVVRDTAARRLLALGAKRLGARPRWPTVRPDDDRPPSGSVRDGSKAGACGARPTRVTRRS